MTEQELIDALVEAFQEDDAIDYREGFILKEIVTALGCTEYRAKKNCDQLMAAGKLVPVMVRRFDAWGHRQSLKGYKLV